MNTFFNRIDSMVVFVYTTAFVYPVEMHFALIHERQLRPIGDLYMRLIYYEEGESIFVTIEATSSSPYGDYHRYTTLGFASVRMGFLFTNADLRERVGDRHDFERLCEIATSRGITVKKGNRSECDLVPRGRVLENGHSDLKACFKKLPHDLHQELFENESPTRPGESRSPVKQLGSVVAVHIASETVDLHAKTSSIPTAEMRMRGERNRVPSSTQRPPAPPRPSTFDVHPRLPMNPTAYEKKKRSLDRI